MKNHLSVEQAIGSLQPRESVYFLRPHVIDRTARWFLNAFPGNVMYSVKSNPDETALRTLYNAGVRHFDVASLAEVELIAKLFPDVRKSFMHTVKSREAIRAAYFTHGIREYSLDSFQELKKIQEETMVKDSATKKLERAKDLTLFVRIAVPNLHSELDLSGKFGAQLSEAGKLLKRVRKVAAKVGVCFHVGSQCMDPKAYAYAISLVKNMVQTTGVKLDILDVGGGFPSVYPGMVPPPLTDYMRVIKEAVATMPNADELELWCEPGRALVAESGSLVVRVELRKGNMLYINDGVYGSLFDAGTPKWLFPTKLIRTRGEASGKLMPFGFYGPTCDSIDVMKGPFMLPDDIQEGDYIEIGQLGAYCRAMQSNFNGFASKLQMEATDEPMLSIFKLPRKRREKIAATR